MNIYSWLNRAVSALGRYGVKGLIVTLAMALFVGNITFRIHNPIPKFGMTIAAGGAFSYGSNSPASPSPSGYNGINTQYGGPSTYSNNAPSSGSSTSYSAPPSTSGGGYSGVNTSYGSSTSYSNNAPSMGSSSSYSMPSSYSGNAGTPSGFNSAGSSTGCGSCGSNGSSGTGSIGSMGLGPGGFGFGAGGSGGSGVYAGANANYNTFTPGTTPNFNAGPTMTSVGSAYNLAHNTELGSGPDRQAMREGIDRMSNALAAHNASPLIATKADYTSQLAMKAYYNGIHDSYVANHLNPGIQNLTEGPTMAFLLGAGSITSDTIKTVGIGAGGPGSSRPAINRSMADNIAGYYFAAKLDDYYRNDPNVSIFVPGEWRNRPLFFGPATLANPVAELGLRFGFTVVAPRNVLEALAPGLVSEHDGLSFNGDDIGIHALGGVMFISATDQNGTLLSTGSIRTIVEHEGFHQGIDTIIALAAQDGSSLLENPIFHDAYNVAIAMRDNRIYSLKEFHLNDAAWEKLDGYLDGWTLSLNEVGAMSLRELEGYREHLLAAGLSSTEADGVMKIFGNDTQFSNMMNSLETFAQLRNK